MKFFSSMLVALALTTQMAPAFAASEPALELDGQKIRGLVPAQLDSDDKRHYLSLFDAIAKSDWNLTQKLLADKPDGVLTDIARAEYYLSKGSPRIEGQAFADLYSRANYLPQAAQLRALAEKRGITGLSDLPQYRVMVRKAGASRRTNLRSTAENDANAAQLKPKIISFIKNDKPSEAENVLVGNESSLSPEARTEFYQRTAWSYYLTGDDASAQRMAAIAHNGEGEWASMADWVGGLAAWRSGNYRDAAAAFNWSARRATNEEMEAAGYFWSARAEAASGKPANVQALLRQSARHGETFYGMLARTALGIRIANPNQELAGLRFDWKQLSRQPNIRIASALTEIGKSDLADEVLRHQSQIGVQEEHLQLLSLAIALDLPATEVWLAQNGPVGVTMPVNARFPAPNWEPVGGWRVDRSLIFAHALQESQFRKEAKSYAGARGLMQLMPGTAQMIARKRGLEINGSNYTLPAVNFEMGQSYLEHIRDFPGIDGMLPKVIAAYNAGPTSVQKWQGRIKGDTDPLLYIESIPFIETRSYVATVLRNYWMYQQNRGQEITSLKAMAQGMWPRFPGLPGKTALRMSAIDGTGNGN